MDTGADAGRRVGVGRTAAVDAVAGLAGPSGNSVGVSGADSGVDVLLDDIVAGAAQPSRASTPIKTNRSRNGFFTFAPLSPHQPDEQRSQRRKHPGSNPHLAPLHRHLTAAQPHRRLLQRDVAPQNI